MEICIGKIRRDKTFVIGKAEQNVILAINNEVAISEQITQA